MTVRIKGTLVIKEIKGANGKFCVGDLNTPEGDFKIKEPILDQFEEGRYEGEFIVERFYLSSYVWRGKSTTDIRAKVTEIFLDTIEEGMVEDAPAELDPISTEPASLPDQTVDAPVPATVVDDAGGELNPVYQELLNLFGADLARLVFVQEEVKLDPTVDRALFRQQRDKLKESGYTFDAKSQTWLFKAAEKGE